LPNSRRNSVVWDVGFITGGKWVSKNEYEKKNNNKQDFKICEKDERKLTFFENLFFV
jgi:hypothetical protein